MAILVVDDSATQRLALAGVLDEAGFPDLILAGTAAEALAALQAATPTAIDLVLTDLHMPDVDGIAVCQQIKAMPAWADLPIIMITSSSEIADLRGAFAAGAMDYITKPSNEIELQARVGSALRLKREMDRRKAHERELVAVNRQLGEVLGDLAEQHTLLQEEQEKSEQLLRNILPDPVAARLKDAPGIIADRFDEVTVLFADIAEFTHLAAEQAPEAVVRLLNDVFSLFDGLADRHGLEKIKTIGDAYMVAGGLPRPRPDHATAVVALALDLQAAVQARWGGDMRVRMGIHSGPVVAGVIGQKKFSYDLWGDTVNTASRMESHGMAGQIQITEATYRAVRHAFECVPRGSLPVKGKGEMAAWWVTGPKLSTPVYLLNTEEAGHASADQTLYAVGA